MVPKLPKKSHHGADEQPINRNLPIPLSSRFLTFASSLAVFAGLLTDSTGDDRSLQDCVVVYCCWPGIDVSSTPSGRHDALLLPNTLLCSQTSPQQAYNNTIHVFIYKAKTKCRLTAGGYYHQQKCSSWKYNTRKSNDSGVVKTVIFNAFRCGMTNYHNGPQLT